MAKLQPKAVVKTFASEEINPNLEPTPIGEWAGGGAVTPSLDPEVLLENASQGITKMTLQSGSSNVILPPASDIAGLYYSFTYFLKALQQSGIAEYSTAQDYHLNDITKLPNGSKIYRSLVNDNIGNPLTDITKWEELDLLALKQATISQRGTLQIATISDINTGTDNTKALTIANLRASNINFTGTLTAPTQPITDNSTKIATTEYLKNYDLSIKKFGINVSDKISFTAGTLFTAPENGTIKMLATINPDGSYKVVINGQIAWIDSSTGTQKTYNYTFPIGKNQTINITNIVNTTFLPLVFFPYNN